MAPSSTRDPGSDSAQEQPLPPSPIGGDGPTGVLLPGLPCRGQFDEQGRLCLLVSGIHDRRRLVLTDTATWASVWQQIRSPFFPPPEIPAVDFMQERVLLMSMGERASGS